MSEKEVKNCSKDQVDNVLRDLNRILGLGMSLSESALVVESTELFIALRFLKSSNLEKRLKGLQDIKFMIDRIIKTQRNAYIRQRAVSQWKNHSDIDMEVNKIPETGYFNCPLMCKWLKDNKVVEIILGEGAHIEIVKRCDTILRFVAKNAQDLFFDAAMVDLTWRC
jgi:ubiquitin carboxyl-terminal hydrolase 9/24